MRRTSPGRIIFAGIGLLTAGCQLPSGSIFDGPSPFGRPGPTFDVSGILSARVIRGANYEIERPVRTVDDRFVFRIRTRYGVQLAHGMDMLELRLREMYSIQLAEKIRNDAHIQAGIAGGLRKTGEGLGQLLTDPAGTLLRVPSGVQEMVQEKLDPADSRAGSLARRRLAAQIRCDPETGNPVLKWMLDEMSLKQDIGDFATGTALGFVVPVPGVGLLSTSADMNQMLATTPPHKVNEDLAARLERAGIEPGLCRQFCGCTAYTTVERLIFMQHFEPLRSTPGLSVLLASMLDVHSEADALAAIHRVMLWGRIGYQRPIRQFVNASPPAAVLRDGALAVVSAADYLTDARDVLKLAARYRAAGNTTPVVFYLAGRISPEAQAALRSANIQLANADGSLR